MKKRLLILAALAALPSCGSTKDANGNPIQRPSRPSWTSTGFSFSIGFQGLTAGITIPARSSEPALPEAGPDAKSPVSLMPK